MITREELYELVWSAPIIKVAEKFDDREELVMAMVDGSKLVKWLDVPDGPMASGEAAFVTGHLKRSNAGQRDQT